MKLVVWIFVFAVGFLLFFIGTVYLAAHSTADETENLPCDCEDCSEEIDFHLWERQCRRPIVDRLMGMGEVS